MAWGKAKLISAGFVLGSAGVKLLTSDDAKKVYTHVTAAVLRCSDEVMRVYGNLKDNCGDIASDARDINDKRAIAKEEKLIADAKAVLAAHEEEAE